MYIYIYRERERERERERLHNRYVHGLTYNYIYHITPTSSSSLEANIPSVNQEITHVLGTLEHPLSCSKELHNFFQTPPRINAVLTRLPHLQMPSLVLSAIYGLVYHVVAVKNPNI